MENNTLDNLEDLNHLFQHKMDLYNFLKNEMLFLYKIIISTLNNIQNNFMIKKIGNEEYNKNLNDINKLYEKFTGLQKQIKLEDLEAKKPALMGVAASDYNFVVGKKLARDLKKWDFINKNDLI